MLAAAFACMASLASCELDFDDPYAEDDDTVAFLDGNTLTYGSHHYTLEEADGRGTVTFTHFPATVREFTTLQEQLLGTSQPGTLALNLMAFEMFRRNRTKGQKCIEMCNVSVNAKSVLNSLRQKFPEHREDEAAEGQQPYLVASFLAGATQDNNYQPEYPYTLSFDYGTSAGQGEYSLPFFGRIYHWLTSRASNKDYDATVIVFDDDDIVLVHGCSNYLLSSPAVSSWEDTLK